MLGGEAADRASEIWPAPRTCIPNEAAAARPSACRRLLVLVAAGLRPEGAKYAELLR